MPDGSRLRTCTTTEACPAGRWSGRHPPPSADPTQKAICCRIFTPAALPEYPAASVRDYCSGEYTTNRRCTLRDWDVLTHREIIPRRPDCLAEGPGFEPGLTESDGVFGRSACPSWG